MTQNNPNLKLTALKKAINIYKKKHDWQAVIEHWQQIADDFPDELLAHYEIAEIFLYELQDEVQARYFYTQQVKKMPNLPDGYKGLVKMAKTQKNWQTLLALADTFIKKFPHLNDGYQWQGHAYTQLGNYEQAKSAFASIRPTLADKSSTEDRLKAETLLTYFANQSFESMKNQLIVTHSAAFMTINYEPQSFENLALHLNHLKQEFIDVSELDFYHAVLIILLRRGYQPTETFKKFDQLWQAESNYLLENLSVRWLVSACDTYVDCCDNPMRKAILMNAASLVNTLKVYETKLDLYDCQTQLSPEKIQRHYANHQLLYEGLTYFRIGTDDTLYQMLKRYQKFESDDPFAYRLLMTIFRRLETQTTAFTLMKALHLNKRHLWQDSQL